MQLKKLCAAVSAALAVAGAQAAQQETASTLADQQSVAVTIYNEDLALIKDTRRVTLTAGTNSLALREVSGRMRPETASLRSLTHPGALSLLEQNFDFDLLTPAKLLEKYVGRDVRIIRMNPKTGVETIETATVLAANNGVVLKIGDRIETGLPGRIVYDGVPPNLRDRPTLVTELQSGRAGSQTVELSYLSGGLAWKADYVAELNAADSALDLNGWVTLTNTSGTAYPNARLQLVAGDVNRVRDEMRLAAKASAMRAAEAPAARQMTQESLFEYHLYTLQRPTDVLDKEQKQVTLLEAAGVGVEKKLIFAGQEYWYQSQYGDLAKNQKVSVYLDIHNSEQNHLGQPLPKGTLRVYKADKNGAKQFVGEDAIDHTPRDEKLRVKVGEAFDVVADRKQMSWNALGNCSSESAWQIDLRNHKDEDVKVEVREPTSGDWTIVNSSLPAQRDDAHTFHFDVPVPKRGATKVTYRVRVRWC